MTKFIKPKKLSTEVFVTIFDRFPPTKETKMTVEDAFAEYLAVRSDRLIGSATLSDYALEIGAAWDNIKGAAR
jgi:hypothetical protein